MPCYDPTPPEVYEAHYAKEKVDKLTRLLCEATEKLENNDLLDDCSKELVDWAHEHTQIDVLRLEDELKQIQKKAKAEWLKTLTPRERELMKGK